MERNHDTDQCVTATSGGGDAGVLAILRTKVAFAVIIGNIWLLADRSSLLSTGWDGVCSMGVTIYAGSGSGDLANVSMTAIQSNVTSVGRAAVCSVGFCAYGSGGSHLNMSVVTMSAMSSTIASRATNIATSSLGVAVDSSTGASCVNERMTILAVATNVSSRGIHSVAGMGVAVLGSGDNTASVSRHLALSTVNSVVASAGTSTVCSLGVALHAGSNGTVEWAGATIISISSNVTPKTDLSGHSASALGIASVVIGRYGINSVTNVTLIAVKSTVTATTGMVASSMGGTMYCDG